MENNREFSTSISNLHIHAPRGKHAYGLWPYIQHTCTGTYTHAHMQLPRVLLNCACSSHTEGRARPAHLKATFIKLPLSPFLSNESSSEVSRRFLSSAGRGPSPEGSILEEGDAPERASMTTPCFTGQKLSTLRSLTHAPIGR